jgi:Fe-S-cluster containining protein
MVVEEQSISILVKRVADIYEWLDNQLTKNTELANLCKACGRCCDFDSFEHRLYVTTPEIMYLAAKLGKEGIKPMTDGKCPYNIEGKCTIRDIRFAGCRIFFCKGDKDFQSALSNQAIVKFKSICEELQIPYRYVELKTALNCPDF